MHLDLVSYMALMVAIGAAGTAFVLCQTIRDCNKATSSIDLEKTWSEVVGLQRSPAVALTVTHDGWAATEIHRARPPSVIYDPSDMGRTAVFNNPVLGGGFVSMVTFANGALDPAFLVRPVVDLPNDYISYPEDL